MKKNILSAFAILVGFVSMSQSTDGMTKVLDDSFRNNKVGWFTSMNGENRSKVDNSNELLIIGVNKANSGERSWANTDIDFNQDFVLKARIKSEKGKKGKEEVKYGLFIGLSDFKYREEQGWYGFRLHANEKKAWFYASNNNGTELFTSEKSDISYNSADFNEIAIEKTGNTVNFYLNGNQIYSNDATETSASSIILDARNIQKVSMDKIEIYQ